MTTPVKRKRASKPKVRTGCITCKCTSTGRKCDGYALQIASSEISPLFKAVTAAKSGMESRALEFFFHRSASQLAGFFELSFWKGTVLQLSLVEPAIRQAIAAIGSLHEHKGGCKLLPSFNAAGGDSDPAMQMYTRAIRSTIEAAAADSSAIPVVIVASILFTTFEFLRGDASAAASHISGGINLLWAWREKTGGQPKVPWGQRYSSFQSEFVETELAPFLSHFNLNTSAYHPETRKKVLLNPVQTGRLLLADSVEPLTIINGLRPTRDRWKTNFDDLVRRQETQWKKNEQDAADILRLMWHSTLMATTSSRAGSQCAWDEHREDFEEIIRIGERIVSEPDRYPDELSKTLFPEEAALIPEHVRVHNFCTQPTSKKANGFSLHKLTLMTKPDGLDGKWDSTTEVFWLPTPREGEAAAPFDLFCCTGWAKVKAERANPHAVTKMTTVVLGLEELSDINSDVSFGKASCRQPTPARLPSIEDREPDYTESGPLPSVECDPSHSVQDTADIASHNNHPVRGTLSFLDKSSHTPGEESANP
ncbi:hypothetical protein BDV28DRAFT_155040 [Aspergillus coremiiformis]|uniref:Zn(2)-C6 fungal-type domain-containing protein n=1 Tax=Aspergillus coremiiformis TaxID=138285 RepID=A0A5N6ZG70_9EURO|nr:hypothetical protein BDV28DRAFT_155040 [Aspergillus coremiiformis]